MSARPIPCFPFGTDEPFHPDKLDDDGCKLRDGREVDWESSECR